MGWRVSSPTPRLSDSFTVVEVDRVPAAMHAPTAWTIARGIFFGLWMFTLSAAIIGFLVSTLLFRQLMDRGNDPQPVPTQEMFEPEL